MASIDIRLFTQHMRVGVCSSEPLSPSDIKQDLTTPINLWNPQTSLYWELLIPFECNDILRNNDMTVIWDLLLYRQPQVDHTKHLSLEQTNPAVSYESWPVVKLPKLNYYRPEPLQLTHKFLRICKFTGNSSISFPHSDILRNEVTVIWDLLLGNHRL